jgi:hypothetical protein
LNNINLDIRDKNYFSADRDQLSDIRHISYESPNVESDTISPKEYTYSIWAISSRSSYSSDFFHCTGLICHWIHKKSNEKISFLTHQDPLKILYVYKNWFISDMEKQLLDMLKDTKEWTLSLGVFWWDITNSDPELYNYTNQLNLLNRITSNILDVRLKVLIGTNNMLDTNIEDVLDRSSHFIYNNESSTIQVYKPEQKTTLTNKSFYADEVHKVLSGVKWF